MALVHLVGLLAFAGFAATALFVVVAQRGRDETVRRQLASALIAYVLIVSAVAGTTHRDLWPFSGWPMMTVPPPEAVGPELPFSWIYGVTADGSEYALDARTVQPISMSELLAWLDYDVSRMSPEDRERVGEMILRMANEGREAVLRGEAPGYLSRRMGPLLAPHHLLLATPWAQPSDVPGEPFVGIRWYRETWNIEGRYEGTADVQRTLGFEFTR